MFSLFLFMCLGALPTCVSIHHVYAEACCMRGQKRASDPEELEVTLAVHMDPGMEPRSSGRIGSHS